MHAWLMQNPDAEYQNHQHACCRLPRNERQCSHIGWHRCKPTPCINGATATGMPMADALSAFLTVAVCPNSSRALGAEPGVPALRSDAQHVQTCQAPNLPWLLLRQGIAFAAATPTPDSFNKDCYRGNQDKSCATHQQLSCLAQKLCQEAWAVPAGESIKGETTSGGEGRLLTSNPLTGTGWWATDTAQHANMWAS